MTKKTVRIEPRKFHSEISNFAMQEIHIKNSIEIKRIENVRFLMFSLLIWFNVMHLNHKHNQFEHIESIYTAERDKFPKIIKFWLQLKALSFNAPKIIGTFGLFFFQYIFSKSSNDKNTHEFEYT